MQQAAATRKWLVDIFARNGLELEHSCYNVFNINHHRLTIAMMEHSPWCYVYTMRIVCSSPLNCRTFTIGYAPGKNPTTEQIMSFIDVIRKHCLCSGCTSMHNNIVCRLCNSKKYCTVGCLKRHANTHKQECIQIRLIIAGRQPDRRRVDHFGRRYGSLGFNMLLNAPLTPLPLPPAPKTQAEWFSCVIQDTNQLSLLSLPLDLLRSMFRSLDDATKCMLVETCNTFKRLLPKKSGKSPFFRLCRYAIMSGYLGVAEYLCNTRRSTDSLRFSDYLQTILRQPIHVAEWLLRNTTTNPHTICLFFGDAFDVGRSDVMLLFLAHFGISDTGGWRRDSQRGEMLRKIDYLLSPVMMSRTIWNLRQIKTLYEAGLLRANSVTGHLRRAYAICREAFKNNTRENAVIDAQKLYEVTRYLISANCFSYRRGRSILYTEEYLMCHTIAYYSNT